MQPEENPLTPTHRAGHGRLRTIVALALAASVLAACGGSDAADDPATDDTAAATTVAEQSAEETTADETADATADDAAMEETATDDAAESEAAAPTGTWDGPDPVATLDARMDELGAVFGQPLSPEAVAPLFEIHADFPYPADPINGVARSWERDLRITDEIRINEIRAIGLEPAADEAVFDAVVAEVEAAAGRWARSSSQRQELINDLYTADGADGGTDRLVYHGRTDPAPEEPTTQIEVESLPTEIPEPAWAAALPSLEGGELVTVAEGRGRAADFGDPPSYDGRIEIRWFYPAERLPDLEAYLASGVVEAAGFTVVEGRLSNFIARVDVEAGDWAGIAGISEVSVDGEVIGHHLSWFLTRGAPA